ncbi:hypothetical protein BHE74_00035062 [Ensete ventricosum]|nr:hypothetical protein BHE74_00035062 [Ensete ventricosum]
MLKFKIIGILWLFYSASSTPRSICFVIWFEHDLIQQRNLRPRSFYFYYFHE